MSGWMQHLIIGPIVLLLVVAASMLLIDNNGLVKQATGPARNKNLAIGPG